MKTILVTGASSGIGRALALRAARAGLCVIGIGRDAERLRTLAGEGRIDTMIADVGDPSAAKRIVAFAMEKGGGIDVLVNNAGAASPGALIDQTDDALRMQFGTHVIGPVALVREALGALKASRGQVIMIGSGVARVPVNGIGAYSPAKAALRSATAILRRELRPFGIAVTYVDPAVVDTPFMERAGLAGAPKPLRVSPDFVARKIWHAIATRPREVNAVPWQTAAVMLGEHFPRIADAVLSRTRRIAGTQQAASSPTVTPSVVSESERSRGAAEIPHETKEEPEHRLRRTTREPEAEQNDLASILEPLARRMERSGLRMEFVESLLVLGARLEAGEVAMRWAGMPNKHERALTLDVLRALEAAGYLAPSGDEVWTVSGKR